MNDLTQAQMKDELESLANYMAVREMLPVDALAILAAAAGHMIRTNVPEEAREQILANVVAVVRGAAEMQSKA